MLVRRAIPIASAFMSRGLISGVIENGAEVVPNSTATAFRGPRSQREGAESRQHLARLNAKISVDASRKKNEGAGAAANGVAVCVHLEKVGTAVLSEVFKPLV